MRRVVLAVGVFGAAAGLLLVAGPGRASLYSPEDPFAVPVSDDGKASPLPFAEFKRRLAVLTNALVEPKAGEEPNPDRKRFLDRIAKQPAADSPAARKLSNPEAAALAADLLRVGQTDKVLNLLTPRRRPDYYVLATLGHVHAMRGEWADALKFHKIDRMDAEMPEAVKGLSKAQRDWWKKVDDEYVTHLYQIRKHESDARRGLPPSELDRANEDEDVLALFPAPGDDGKPRPPARFVNDAGTYQPGTLAQSERAKLPPDAFAVVQQLVLWFPTETRLYWLLAELYASIDDLDSAAQILDECAWSRQYGNRKVLMDHRAAVRAAIDARPKPEEPKPPEDPISMKTVGIYFAAVAAIGLVAFLRTMMRRKFDGGSASGCGPIG